jgi:RimJ/RimL family protein N-acetyltransferase
MHSVFLQGKSIFLGPLSKREKFSEYVSWLNDQETTLFMSSGKFPATMDALPDYVASYEKNPCGMLLGIFLKSSKKHIGNITLHQIDWRDRHGEIGIMIGDKKQWGKGYGKEAIALVLYHAFNKLNLHKVCAGFIDGNIGSQKAFAALGFKVEGVLREQFYLNNRYYDCCRVGLLKDEYRVNIKTN